MFFSSLGFTQNTRTEVKKQILLDFIARPKVNDTIVLLTTLMKQRSFDEKNYRWIKEKYKRFDKSTFDDFKLQNLDDPSVSDYKIPRLYIIIDKGSNYKNWDDIQKKYGFYSIVEISNVGFNEDRNQAIVYYGYYSAPLTAGGYFIVYKRKRSKWRKTKVIMAWAT